MLPHTVATIKSDATKECSLFRCAYNKREETEASSLFNTPRWTFKTWRKMNGSSSTEPSLLGVMWKNNLLPGNSQANVLTNSHQTLKTCCVQVSRTQINSETATVGKSPKVSRDGEEEQRRAQLNQQQDVEERRSRQRNPS